MVDYIQCDDSNINVQSIANILPQWKTRIINVTNNSEDNVKVKFLIAANTKEQIKLWLNEFQEKTNTTYSIKCTEQCTGRYIEFKQRLYCHHNQTRNPNVYDPTVSKRIKNTHCPSAMTIRLRAIKKRYRGKSQETAPNPEMPCEITLIATHNHSIKTADALQFRKVSDSTKNKLLELYEKGHTPVTALETIKLDLCSDQNNSKILLGDRKFCPDYSYCYYLYRQKYGPLKLENESKATSDKKSLDKRKLKRKHVPLEFENEIMITAHEENLYTEKIEENLDTEIIEENLDAEIIKENLDTEIIVENLDREIMEENLDREIIEENLDREISEENYVLLKYESEIEATAHEENLEMGKKAIEKISATLNGFLADSADDVAPALELFSESLESIETNTAFVSSIANFVLKN